VTGASAGGTNALMAARCGANRPARSATRIRPESLPRSLGARRTRGPAARRSLSFTPTDGVFTAAPLERAFQRLRAELFGPKASASNPAARSRRVDGDARSTRGADGSGLRVRRQRFVVPWRFEVDPDGQPRIVSAPLASGRDSGDAQLLLGEPRASPASVRCRSADGARLRRLSFAFRPRQLCDCSLRCPDERGRAGRKLPGPDPGQSITGLSCEAVRRRARPSCAGARTSTAALRQRAHRSRRRSRRSDGRPRRPFSPAVYLFVDPDNGACRR